MTCPFSAFPPKKKFAFHILSPQILLLNKSRKKLPGWPFLQWLFETKGFAIWAGNLKSSFRRSLLKAPVLPQMCLDQPSQGIFGVAYRQRNKVYPHDEDLSSMCVKKSSCSATWHSNVCFFVSLAVRRFPFPKMAFVQCAREKWQDPHIIDLYIHAYGKLTYSLLFDGKDGVYVLPFPSGKPFSFSFCPPMCFWEKFFLRCCFFVLTLVSCLQVEVLICRFYAPVPRHPYCHL